MTGVPAGGGAGEEGAREERPPFTPAPEDLEAYVGEYYSPDAETMLTIVVDEGRVFALRRPASRIALTPAERDRFNAGGGLGGVRFVRDSSGRVTELAVSQERVFDLRFGRVR